MCRFFGVFSDHRVDPSRYLLEAPRSLFRQSRCAAKRKQGDGWGVGWFVGNRPNVIKSPRALYRDGKPWRKAAARARGNLLLGHVRWASNPLKLPRRELIGVKHTQPFTHGSWVFVHNGTLFIPREVKAALGDWAKYVKGNNDSEVLFYWLLKTVVARAKTKSWPGAIKQSFRQLDGIWSKSQRKYPLYKYPYHGLNWILTNGKVFLVFCYVNPNGFDRAKALCDRRQPYYQLQVQVTQHIITVASEPLTLENNWQPVKHGQLVIAQKQGRHLAMKILQVM